jgi:antitoxin HigA-1
MKKPRVIDPTTPGEMLTEEFLIPMGMSQSELARKIGCSPRVINEICHDKRGISTIMAFHLSGVFKNTPEFWINLQVANDIWKTYLMLKGEKKAS